MDVRHRGVRVHKQVIVERQAIVNPKMDVIGYELGLLSPAGRSTRDLQAPTDGDSARLLVATFVEAGIESLVGSSVAFLHVARSLVEGSIPLPVPPAQLGLQVHHGDRVDRTLISALKRRRQQGFHVVVDHFRGDAETAPLLTVADYARIDLDRTDETTARRWCQQFRVMGIKVIGAGLETPDHLEVARALDCDGYQGGAVREATHHGVDGLPMRRAARVALNEFTSGPPPDPGHLVRRLARDPALVFRLLRFVNTATFPGRREIASIDDAVRLLGSEGLTDWARLIDLADLWHEQAPTATRIALHRARACRGRAHAESPERAEEAFLTGMLSTVDAITGLELEDALDMLPVRMDVKLALLGGEGELGHWLHLAVRGETPCPGKAIAGAAG